MKSTLYTLSLLLFVSISSCRTKDGTPGPAGTSYLKQQGTVNGTLKYEKINGDSVSYKFNYSFYDSEIGNQFNYDSVETSRYVIDFYRLDAKESNNIFAFRFSGNLKAPTQFPPQQGPLRTAAIIDPQPPTDITIDFDFLTESKNELFVFQDGTNNSDEVQLSSSNNGTSNFKISNYSFNVKTGNLVFDYVITYDYGDIKYPYNQVGDAVFASITGSVNVILQNNPYNTNFFESQPVTLK